MNLDTHPPDITRNEPEPSVALRATLPFLYRRTLEDATPDWDD